MLEKRKEHRDLLEVFTDYVLGPLKNFEKSENINISTYVDVSLKEFFFFFRSEPLILMAS